MQIDVGLRSESRNVRLQEICKGRSEGDIAGVADVLVDQLFQRIGESLTH